MPLAEMTGAAIEYTRINREAHRTELLAERRVIANDIHDSLAQTLTFARMRNSMLLEAIRAGNQLMATRYAKEIDEALARNPNFRLGHQIKGDLLMAKAPLTALDPRSVASAL